MTSKVLKSANPKVIRHVRKTKEVTTLDNGDTPFIVKFNDQGVCVQSLLSKKHPTVLTVLDVDEIWIGCGFCSTWQSIRLETLFSFEKVDSAG
jgi:hypothetical protein